MFVEILSYPVFDASLKHSKLAAISTGPLSIKRSSRSNFTTDREKENNKRNNIVIPNVTGVLEKLGGFSRTQYNVHFKARNTLKQKLVHPKNKISRH